MIIQITKPAKLQGAIATEFVKCMEAYCAKAQDGVTVPDLAQIIDDRVFGNQTAWMFLGLDERYRVKAFAIVRIVADVGVGKAVDLWHCYIDPKAPPGLMAEGINTIKDTFSKAGITRLQFSSRRDADKDGKAWERLMRSFGFVPKSVTFEMEVLTDGKSES